MPKNEVKSTYSQEEQRIRKRLMALGLRQHEIASALGIGIPDVNHVIRGRSRSPRYVAAVYSYLGLEMPNENGIVQEPALLYEQLNLKGKWKIESIAE